MQQFGFKYPVYFYGRRPGWKKNTPIRLTTLRETGVSLGIMGLN